MSRKSLAPVDPERSREHIRRLLKEHFRRHNRLVLWMVALTTLSSTAKSQYDAAVMLIISLRSERRIAWYKAPLIIPDPKMLRKVVEALQLVELVETRRNHEEIWLALRSPRRWGENLGQTATRK